MAILDLGKVRTTFNGAHDSSKAYEKLCIVHDGFNVKFISIKDVPKDTEITDRDYWQPLSGDFVEWYQGEHDSDPDKRNDGNDLNTGDLYYNSTDDVVKVYTDSGWQRLTSDDITEFVNQKVKADGDIDKLTLVYHKAESDGYPTVSTIDALSEIPYGLCVNSQSDGDVFYLLRKGLINGLDTSKWSAGDKLFSDGNGGIQTKGIGSSIGSVVKVDPDNGSISLYMNEMNTVFEQNAVITKSTKIESGITMMVDGLSTEDGADLTIDGDILDIRKLM